MHTYIRFLCLSCSLVLAACTEKPTPNTSTVICDQNSFQVLEQLIGTGDGEGHGPDVGSHEWQSVIEFRLQLRGDKNLPAHDHPDWCAYILQAAHER